MYQRGEKSSQCYISHWFLFYISYFNALTHDLMYFLVSFHWTSLSNIFFPIDIQFPSQFLSFSFSVFRLLSLYRLKKKSHWRARNPRSVTEVTVTEAGVTWPWVRILRLKLYSTGKVNWFLRYYFSSLERYASKTAPYMAIIWGLHELLIQETLSSFLDAWPELC